MGRELIEIARAERFIAPTDYLRLLPEGLPDKFTARELAHAAHISWTLAGKMVYSLKLIGAIAHTGKRGNAFVYERVNGGP